MGEPLISKILSTKACKIGIPLSGTFELSPCCNLSCKMCYVRKTRKEVEDAGGEISVDKWIDIAKKLRDKGMLFLLLTGGEPLLYKDFKELYIELKKMGFMISINTNGTLIDEKMVEFFKKNPPTRINITLYGGSKDTYDRLCNNSEGFDKTVNAIKLLKRAGISVKVNASMTPYNINDLEDIFKIGKENNVHVQASSYMFPPIRRDEKMIGMGDRFTPEDASKYRINIDQFELTDEQIYEKTIALHKGISKCEKNNDECLMDKNEPLGCRAGKCAFWINWKGDMTACGMFNNPSVNVLEKGVDYAWKEIKNSTARICMPKECTNCKMRFACTVCGASVITETGGFREKPQYLCKMTENILLLYEKEYQRLKIEGKVNNENKEGVH